MKAPGGALWIWGPRTDLFAFGGSAALALALVLLGHALDLAEVPEWGYLALVLGVDVAHVWSTLFRTYLDGDELRKRRTLYVFLPLGVWFIGFLLYRHSALTFWRAFAYLAVFHFMRQQVGWAAIYRAKARLFSRVDRLLDDALLYLATGVPLLYWHATPSRNFKWFVTGDFFGGEKTLAFASRLLPFADGLYALVAVAFATRFFFFAPQRQWGRLLLIVSTAACWWIGIRATNSDFDFTATNVLIHGIPYMVLLYRYGTARAKEAPRVAAATLLRGGVGAFMTTLLVFAFLEEMVWDRQVWHDHPVFFGHSSSPKEYLLTFLVPLFALPQGTHYALDAFLWRRRDVTPAQSRALGFEPA